MMGLGEKQAKTQASPVSHFEGIYPTGEGFDPHAPMGPCGGIGFRRF